MKAKNQGKQTKGGTSQGAPMAKGGLTPQESNKPTEVGVGKQGQEPDTGRGVIDHHQSNHGRRGR